MSLPATPRRARTGLYPAGLAAVIVTVVMLFTAFTAALIVRRTGSDWAPIVLPPILWANTAALILSSIAVERATRAAAGYAVLWLRAAVLLGVLFLAGQIGAWRALAADGLGLASNPHAAFFYMLTAVHGTHVVGGLAALGWTLRRARNGAYRDDRTGLAHAAFYWHLVGGVWCWLLALLLVL
jgi:cytochrome c oxidase subunit 3